MSRDRGLARRAANSARARAATSKEPWAHELRRLAAHVDRLASEDVVPLAQVREAKAALEVVQDLESVAGVYGYELTVLFTAEGVAAHLDQNGKRCMTVRPQRDVQTAGNHVMCWLAAQEVQS